MGCPEYRGRGHALGYSGDSAQREPALSWIKIGMASTAQKCFLKRLTNQQFREKQRQCYGFLAKRIPLMDKTIPHVYLARTETRSASHTQHPDAILVALMGPGTRWQKVEHLLYLPS